MAMIEPWPMYAFLWEQEKKEAFEQLYQSLKLPHLEKIKGHVGNRIVKNPSKFPQCKFESYRDHH